MSWMIGRNHCTVPTGRLTLGSRTNLNINYQKTTINNFGGGAGDFGCGGFGAGMGMMGMMGMYPTMGMMGMYPTMGMMGMYPTMGMMGMYGMGGMYPVYNDSRADAGAILTGVGAMASAVGGIISAIAGNKAQKTEAPEEEQHAETPANNQFSEFQAQTTEQLASMNTKLQAALKENQDLKAKAAEYQKQQQAAQLKKEGITLNEDGSYTTTYKDITGKEVEIKGSDLNELRMQKLNNENEVLEQQKIIDENGITVNSDGTFSIEQSTQSENGNTTTSQKIKLTSNTLEGLLEQMKEKNIEIKGMEEENQ